MIRLNLNDSGNVVDGVDLISKLSSLEQNYPNPFVDQTEIAYQLASSQDVVIDIKDVTGRQVMHIDEGMKTAGEHQFVLNATSLKSGIYFYTLTAGDYVETKQMVIR